MIIKDKYNNDVFAVGLTGREIRLLGALVTHHIKSLEGLLDEGQLELPEHKKWFYQLEDKLDEHY